MTEICFEFMLSAVMSVFIPVDVTTADHCAVTDYIKWFWYTARNADLRPAE